MAATLGPAEVQRNMIEEVSELCRALVTESVTIDEIAAQIGTVTARHSGGQRLVVSPSSPHFASARVSSATRDSVPTLARLTPSETGSVTVTDFQAHFGDYRITARLHFDNDPQLTFQPDVPQDSVWRCTIIVTVPVADAGEIDDALVKTISLRRDRVR